MAAEAKEMRAIRIEKHGGPEVTKFEEKVAVPQPGPNDVQVQVAYAGVNMIDTYLRGGLYPVPLPTTLGREGAGVISAVGSAVTTYKVGDRVAFCEPGTGAYADYTVLPAARVVPVPEAVSLKMAAAVMLQGVTAQYLVNSTYPVKEGDLVLVHAAAGGTGGLIVQMAKQRGGTVLATVSTEEKAATARALGADHVILYSKVDFLEEVKKLTNGAGVHVVYDGVGQATWERSLKSLRPLGMLAVFGNTTGPVPPIDPLLLSKHGSLFLTRPTMGHYITDPKVLAQRVSHVFQMLTDGKLNVRIAGEFALPQLADAHKMLEGRQAQGKIVIAVNPHLDAPKT